MDVTDEAQVTAGIAQITAAHGGSDCLRLELAPHGIHVIIIEPGVIGTEFGDEVTQPLLDRSGSGPYAELAEQAARATRTAYEKGDNSPPTVISDLIACRSSDEARTGVPGPRRVDLKRSRAG